MAGEWFELVAERTLTQGDVLFSCPVPRVESYAYPLDDVLDVFVETHDLAVVSQSCDLENAKIDEVLLAVVRDYRQLVDTEGRVNTFIRSKSWRKAAVNGDFPPYSVLPERKEAPELPWSLVDFHHLYTLPRGYVEDFAEASGARLRLVTPYREHLAQAFARFFMRVGLPAPLRGFEQIELGKP